MLRHKIETECVKMMLSLIVNQWSIIYSSVLNLHFYYIYIYYIYIKIESSLYIYNYTIIPSPTSQNCPYFYYLFSFDIDPLILSVPPVKAYSVFPSVLLTLFLKPAVIYSAKASVLDPITISLSLAAKLT